MILLGRYYYVAKLNKTCIIKCVLFHFFAFVPYHYYLVNNLFCHNVLWVNMEDGDFRKKTGA